MEMNTKMKITKAQLKQIIKEELEAVVETKQLEGGPEVDIQDAIQMLEADFNKHDEVGAGTLYYVINRLYEALAKLGVGNTELNEEAPMHDEETLALAAELGLDPADYPAEGALEFEINKRMA